MTDPQHENESISPERELPEAEATAPTYTRRPPRASYAWHIAAKILKWAGTLLVFGVCGILLWRVFFSVKVPKSMREVEPNAVLRDTLAETGALEAFTQEQGTTTRGENDYGYFSVPEFVIFPEARQVQLVFRYNNSTLEATKTDFGLDAVPPRGEPVYDVTLLAVRDLTPEDKTDNKDGSETLEKTRIYPTSYRVETTALYTYFYYTFDAVSLENILVLYLDVYYPVSTPDYSAAPYGTLRIYHTESARLEISLSKGELEAIRGFE